MRRKTFFDKYALVSFIVLALVLLHYGFIMAQQKGGSAGEWGSKEDPQKRGPAAPPPQPQASAPSAVLATADGETPGVRVEVMELKRVSGGTVNLRFVMINDSGKAVGFGYSFVDRSHDVVDFNSIGGVHLIDAAGKKKYFVVRDTGKKCVCSQNLKDLQPKSRMNLWAKFPAPPENVEKISIVIPHFMPLDDVPISR
jgi:hypothetical protein